MNAQTALKSVDITTKRILVVEDDPQYMNILTAELKGEGYDVYQASDGSMALGILQRDKDFSLIITDRKMPVIDGMDMVAKIKSDTTLRTIPVIMQTSAIAPRDVVEGLKAGVYYYLTKPYDTDVMRTVVKSALRDRKQTQAFENRFSGNQNAIAHMSAGTFSITTPKEAENLAVFLGTRYPYREIAAQGLYELMLNAIEHGNLGIGFEEKAALLANGTWESEIERRLNLTENRTKKVQVAFVNQPDRLEVTIIDQGAGFAWQPYLEIEPSRAVHANGRGIAKANLLSFDKLVFKGNGNQVTAIKTITP